MRTKSLVAIFMGLIGIVCCSFVVPPAFAVAVSLGWPVEEVPIERLLENIERNSLEPRMSDYWLALGRLHLLAYIRQTKTLPARTGGNKGDEVVDEGPFSGCTPLVPSPKTFWQTAVEMLGMNTALTPSEECRSYDPTLGFPAPPGLPEGTLAVRHPVDDHLRAAVAAYERLRDLNPARIRPRLALAYAYDRLGKIDKALIELRFIVDAADEALRKADSREATYEDKYWDYQIVAAEAIEHLTMISKSKGDSARIKKLRPRLKAPEKMVLYITPIFIPLTADDGMQSFINASADVRFDFTGQGLRLLGGWITKDAAWLVWDPGDKRNVVSGFQLFGSVTWLTPWDNGYLALAALDDNGDGKIAGGELKGLSLWRDANGDGISDKGEVKPVADWNIVALGYRHKRQSKDAWISEAGVTFANGETRPTYDWLVRTRLVTTAAAKAN